VQGQARVFTKNGMTEKLKSRGFKILKTYGDFAKSAYRKESRKIIFVTEKV